jgi:hypothetical protein
MRSARTCARVTNRSSLYAAGVSGAQWHIKADTTTQPVDLQRNKPRGLDQTQPSNQKQPKESRPAQLLTAHASRWWRVGRDLSRAHAERERKVCNPPARPSVLTFDIQVRSPGQLSSRSNPGNKGEHVTLGARHSLRMRKFKRSS